MRTHVLFRHLHRCYHHMVDLTSPDPCDFMRKVKGRSSYLIQREFPALKKRYWGQRFWGRGYFSTTNGAVIDDVVLQYLVNHVAPTGANR